MPLSPLNCFRTWESLFPYYYFFLSSPIFSTGFINRLITRQRRSLHHFGGSPRPSFFHGLRSPSPRCDLPFSTKSLSHQAPILVAIPSIERLEAPESSSSKLSPPRPSSELPVRSSPRSRPVRSSETTMATFGHFAHLVLDILAIYSLTQKLLNLQKGSLEP